MSFKIIFIIWAYFFLLTKLRFLIGGSSLILLSYFSSFSLGVLLFSFPECLEPIMCPSLPPFPSYASYSLYLKSDNTKMNKERKILYHYCFLSFLIYLFHILFASLPFLQFNSRLPFHMASHLEDQLSNMVTVASGQDTTMPLITTTKVFISIDIICAS